MIQIAICDDNTKDIHSLRTMIQEIMGKYSIKYNIQEYKSGEKLLETPLAFHLIFLDIMMDGKDGIEIGRLIYRKNKAVKLVYQSSYGEYCREAMNKSHAFAFLEKPVQMSLVEEQIKEFLESKEQVQGINVEFKNVKYEFGEKENINLSLPVKKIIYFEYLKSKKKIKIVTDSKIYIFSETMNKLEESMRPLGFEISCRGFLINLDRISKIKGYDIILDNGGKLPLSQRRVAEFKERINEYIHDSYQL